MDIALLSPTTLRIKGKAGSIIIDPTSKMPKTPTDGIILFQGETSDSKVEGSRIILNGPGEYEVATIKVKGERRGTSMMYSFTIDSVEVLLASVDDLVSKSKFNLFESKDFHIVVLLVNSTVPKDVLSTLDTKYIALYGPDTSSITEVDGKKATPMSRLSITSISPEKLPTDVEIVTLQ